MEIALPAIVTNITVPLLGLVDTAIVGHMGSAAFIGAVAVGSMIFNLVYWVFGFLRMGTSGMTAQARGRRNFSETTQLLVRSCWVSLSIALLIIVLQWPVREGMLWFIGPSGDVRFEGLLINNPQVVTKSYPQFWEDIKAAGFEVKSEE